MCVCVDLDLFFTSGSKRGRVHTSIPTPARQHVATQRNTSDTRPTIVHAAAASCAQTGTHDARNSENSKEARMAGSPHPFSLHCVAKLALFHKGANQSS